MVSFPVQTSREIQNPALQVITLCNAGRTEGGGESSQERPDIVSQAFSVLTAHNNELAHQLSRLEQMQQVIV